MNKRDWSQMLVGWLVFLSFLFHMMRTSGILIKYICIIILETHVFLPYEILWGASKLSLENYCNTSS